MQFLPRFSNAIFLAQRQALNGNKIYRKRNRIKEVSWSSMQTCRQTGRGLSCKRTTSPTRNFAKDARNVGQGKSYALASMRFIITTSISLVKNIKCRIHIVPFNNNDRYRYYVNFII